MATVLVAEHNREFLDSCAACADACEACAYTCCGPSQEPGAEQAMRSCLDCATLARTLQVLLARGSRHAAALGQLCAQVCEDCARLCDEVGDGACAECARICRECAQRCRALATTG